MEVRSIDTQSRVAAQPQRQEGGQGAPRADFGDLLAKAAASSAEKTPRAEPAPPISPPQKPRGGAGPTPRSQGPRHPAPAAVLDAPARVAGTVAPKADLSSQLERALDPPPEPAGGAWSALVDGPARLTSEYGMRRDPFTNDWRFHEGVDIAAPAGAPVRPFRDGVVTFSGWKGGFGRMVVVKHADGVETAYGHNAVNLVTAGERVTTATELARVGSTGRSTGPHLHFEVRKNGRAVDPAPYLGRLF